MRVVKRPYENLRAHQITLFKAAQAAVNAAIDAGQTKARRASRTWGIWMYEKERERLDEIAASTPGERVAIQQAIQAINNLTTYTARMHTK